MRRDRLRDRLAFGFASLGLLTLVLLADRTAIATAAEGPKPAQKDSSARAKPKDATLTAVIEPAEAKPGETVTLKVTAKLKPGWHIYTQAKNQEGEGPRKTVFDLFDPAGLEVSGDWKARPQARVEGRAGVREQGLRRTSRTRSPGASRSRSRPALPPARRRSASRRATRSATPRAAASRAGGPCPRRP